MSNDTLISKPCPHCGAPQSFGPDALGKSMECTSCGLKYFAPRSVNEDAVRMGPPPAATGAPPPISAPASMPAPVLHESPQDYLVRLREQTRFGVARDMARIGAILLGICVLLMVLANLAGMAYAPGIGAGFGVVVVLGVAFILELVIWASYQFSVVILDIADALIDIGRKTR